MIHHFAARCKCFHQTLQNYRKTIKNACKTICDVVYAHALPPASGPVLLGMGYVCAVLAFVMLVSLYKFLRRIEAGAVFVPANVTALRRISWCCAGAAVVCLAAAYIYLPFAFLGVAAAFMALIVRVLKNAFAQAVHMKDELDYTI